MEKHNRILKVPEDSLVRKQLRNGAFLLVNKVRLLPPVPFEELEKLAIELLQMCDVSNEYIDFAIVLLGNESWRKTVQATPYNRRLLLLPQCLKNHSSCKGKFDSLGLNCAGCKACPIDDILLEAEELGYATLVAEGTTVAIGLVEEGSIDAVIGVSCMAVLQRSFEPVSNAAIPTIGLPLMFDGCENTKIDTSWLFEEIRQFEEDYNYQPISVSGVKAQINDLFNNGAIKNYFADFEETEIIAMQYLQIGGQRMRPMLASLSYIAYAKSLDNEVSTALSFIIESFHKASLIHDDIEDNSDFRYNIDTVHKKHGIPQAINIGDLLIGKGYKVLSDLPVNSEVLAKSFKQVSESHIRLTQGQGADILFNSGLSNPDINETMQIFCKKTGEAIKVALLLGAILGEADETELGTLSKFSDYFGIAYQIRDDLNEFVEERADEKIADFPFLKALMNGNAKPDAQNDVLEFRKLVIANQLDVLAQDYLNKYVNKCYKTLDALENYKLRLGLYSVLGKVFKAIN